jgi:2-C-methyl-D-erythritol 4-phosphate cytidylyltransferase/2-C-methyl-D-erythritol 2,4-cyclodiphosphate synthase
MRFSLIILAAGNSSRFKSSLPKPYHKIGTKTLIELSLNKIRRFKEIKKIVIVCNKKHTKHIKKINLKDVTIINGGKSRQDSTFNALKYLQKYKSISRVLIHDAARPNFSLNLIKKILTASKKNNVVIPFLKLQDALKKKTNKYNFENLQRSNYFLTQTPQGFNFKNILNLHKKYKIKYNNDDLSLFDDSKKTKFIKGEKKNFKITDKSDLDLLRNLHKSNLKIGIGFDVHRLVKGRKLCLGGIIIPSTVGTLGHSDGDPVLHAIIDAILGACQMGDIGEIFSDKNKKFKNVSSKYLIKKIIEKINIRNYEVNNLDINIITQTPKLQKFKNKMINNISKLCGIAKEKINIKAKTTEKLGVIGKEKAIAAEVIVSVIKYD